MDLNYYVLLTVSVILLAFDFLVQKIYQKNCGASPRSCLKFTFLLGIVTAICFFAIGGFKFEFTPVSAIIAFCLSLLAVGYVAIGFKIMNISSVSLYTLFLMTGGMTLPYIWGLVFLDEPFSVLRMIGLVLIIGALITVNGGNHKISGKGLALCIAVFCLNGGVSILSKEHQLMENAVSANGFVVLTSLSKVIISAAALLFVKKDASEPKATAKSYLPVVLSALLSGVSYLLQLISAEKLSASILYPFVTGGSIILTALFGFIFLHEKPSKKTILGLAICFVGTCLFL